jgi:hypothetical protein
LGRKGWELVAQPSGLCAKTGLESQNILGKADQKGDRDRLASVMAGPVAWP